LEVVPSTEHSRVVAVHCGRRQIDTASEMVLRSGGEGRILRNATDGGRYQGPSAPSR
jgi:hypothetical protein